MCRLFGLTAGRVRVDAEFWLLDAPDSLVRQSLANPDGTGLGWFDDRGRPHVEKQSIAADHDPAFAAEAHERRSETFVAHVRRTSGSPIAERNTHPFTLDGRIFAHNGVVGDLPRLEAHLGEDMNLVGGDTDSERVFALVTREIRRAGGDVEAGLHTASTWIAAELPVLSMNLVLAEPGRLWALRYPTTHELWVLERAPVGERLDHRSSLGTRVRSAHLADTGSVVVASERLDEGDWRLLEAGELLSVDPDLHVTRTALLPPAPRGSRPQPEPDSPDRTAADRPTEPPVPFQ